MPGVAVHDELDPTREVILDSALVRLLRFGYHKTTMAEIAQDVSMSAANLYRYFESKKDIVAECAARCMDDRLARLRTIVQEPGSSASEKLLRYALELVDDSHALAGTDSMIGELVDAIARERPSLVHAKNAVHCSLLGEIIAAGVHEGDFFVGDVQACARHVHSSLSLFDVPLFVGLYTREEFEERARGVIAILLAGLRSNST